VWDLCCPEQLVLVLLLLPVQQRPVLLLHGCSDAST
jgi:hypothetical protein